MASRLMLDLDWEQFLVVGLFAVCILGPICVVFLTQNLLDASDDIGREHFDFTEDESSFPDLTKTSSSAKPAPTDGPNGRS